MVFLKRRIILITLLLLLVLAVASALMFNALLQKSTVQSYILKQASRETGYDIRADRMTIHLWKGLGIGLHEVTVSANAEIKSFAASKIGVYFSIAKLLRGNLDIDEIFLLRPRLTLDIQQEDNGSKTVSVDAIEKNLAPIIEKIPSISIEDGRIQFQGMPYSVSGLSLDISKGTVLDSSLRLDMDCMFSTGGINFPLTLRGELRGQNESLKMELNIKDLRLSEISWLDAFQAKGRASAVITLSGTLNHLLAVKGIISADDFSIVHKKGTLSKTYAQPHLTFNFSSQYLDNKIDITNLSLSNGGLLLEGSSSVDLSESKKLKLDLRLKSPFMPLGTFKNIFPAPLLPGWVEGMLFPLLSGGKVRLKRLSLKGTIDEIQNLNQPENAKVLSLEINLKDIAVFKNTEASFLSGVSASLSYDNASLQVFGLTAGLGKSLIKNGVLRIDNLYVDDPLFQYSAETAIDLDDIKKLTKNSRIPDAIRHPVQQCKQLAGMIEGRIKVDHKNKWKYPRIKKSEFSIRDVSIIHRKLVLPLSVDKAKLKIDEAGKVSLIGIGLWGTSYFKADGKGKFDSKKKGSLKAELHLSTDFLDFNQIMDVQKKVSLGEENSVQGKSFMALSDIRLHLEAENGKWKKLPLGRIEADCDFRNGTFFLNQGILKKEHGHLNLKGQVKAGETFFSGEVELVQYPIKSLIENFDLETNLMAADMTLQGTFNMKGPSIKELISGLNGTFDLELSQGTFNKRSVFFDILNLFDVKRLMFRRNRKLLENGLYFNSIFGQIDITNGIMMLKDFQMKTPLFNAVGMGTVDLNDETVDCTLGVEPLGKITSQIDKIPLSGYVLSDTVKSLITYYFHIKGPLSDPEVTSFSPTKLTKRTAKNLKRLFLLPVRRFKKREKEKK
jgi:hypothetical protein